MTISLLRPDLRPSPSEDPDSPSNQIYSMKAAAFLCNVDQKTIRRHIKALEELGAYQAPDKQWRIPYAALAAYPKLTPGRPTGPDKPTAQEPASVGAVPDALTAAQLAALRAENEYLKEMVIRADALTQAERKRADDLSYVLRRELPPGQFQLSPESVPAAPTPRRGFRAWLANT